MNKLSPSGQDYLEAILILAELDNENVRPTDIAERLGVSKASVNQGIKSLKEHGLVRQERYGPVKLTERGKFEARRVHFNHHLIKAFMIETLNIKEEIAENEACQIEHLIGNETVKGVVNYMKNRGLTIEHFDLEKADEFLTYHKRLSELKIGDKAIVKKVEAKGDLKRRIMEMGVIKGHIIEVKGLAPMGDPMELKIGDYKLSLRIEEADQIIVEVV